MVRLGAGAKIGAVIGLLGGLFGILTAIAVAPVTGFLMAVPLVGVFAWVFIAFIRPMFVADRLLREGESAQAFIKEVRDTGVTINNAPQVKITLEVRPKFKQPYETTTKVLVSRLQPDYYRPGMTVAVKFNPAKPQEVVIDPEGGVSAGTDSLAGAGAKNEAEAMKEATEFEAFNKKLLATGQSASAKIVQATPLGFQVNGNNPAVELLLEVEPVGKPKFLSRAKGVIAEASVPKYQTGKAIYVKYDPADTTRVTIDRSA